MPKNKFFPYNPKLRSFARELRNNSTKAEIQLWDGLKGSRLGVKFNRQFPISEFILDFYSKSIQLGIEVDGNSHDNKIGYDEFRQLKIENLGVKVIRFTDEEVLFHTESVLIKIEEEVLKRKDDFSIP